MQQFATLDEIPPAFFEKPYFVVPEPKESAGAFAVVRQAMEQEGVAAVGEITFGGREHLVAVTAPPERSELGMMAYVLRYGEELRNSKEYFSRLTAAQKPSIDKQQLAMATQFIEA